MVEYLCSEFVCHQIFGLALGGSTYKLPWHRGLNHPWNNNQIEITSQNHGFAIDPNSYQRK